MTAAIYPLTVRIYRPHLPIYFPHLLYLSIFRYYTYIIQKKI